MDFLGPFNFIGQSGYFGFDFTTLTELNPALTYELPLTRAKYNRFPGVFMKSTISYKLVPSISRKKALVPRTCMSINLVPGGFSLQVVQDRGLRIQAFKDA